jgi:predicted Fe-Mo cluster-binding NifX family protein
MAKYKLAFATTDRLTVHNHFGHAGRYEIVEIDTATAVFAFTGRRDVTPPCRSGGHSEPAFDAVLAALSDCEGIVVGKIGLGAAEYVLKKGVRVFEAPGVIENIVKTLLDRKMLQERT